MRWKVLAHASAMFTATLDRLSPTPGPGERGNQWLVAPYDFLILPSAF